ncbi:MAG: hypothetical protein QM597_02185 [Aeromicrobium sp.]|uniref:hypothetical protein n=1 Tax=Aeromicrobium sp. TaxID=1871063 RepID=UPI0039E41AED
MSTPVRLFALVSSVLVMVAVAPAAALAGTPVTWESEKGLDFLGYVTLLVGIPAGLFVVITILALATARRSYTPPAPGSEIHVPSDLPDHH